MIQTLLLSAFIFGLSYYVVLFKEANLIEAVEYGAWSIALNYLVQFITPAGATIFNNPATTFTIFAGITLISQARFDNSVKQDLMIAGLALLLNKFIFGVLAGPELAGHIFSFAIGGF